MHIRIKICGVTQPADAIAAAEAGADALGLNFYPNSPRYIDRERAREIVDAVPPFVETVGVFVHPTPILIADLLGEIDRAWLAQCHGDLSALREPMPCRLIPAFSVRDASSVAGISQSLFALREAGQNPIAILVDAHVPGEYGGTGQTAPWSLLADYRPDLPMLLAGGLTPENVAEAIRIVRPFAVDVASGVESSPGRKDPQKVQRFIDNARNAATKLT
jgi:phosphoribosylanthranilate isomerase